MIPRVPVFYLCICSLYLHIWRAPNVWWMDRGLSAPQIDLFACSDRKWSFCMCICTSAAQQQNDFMAQICRKKSKKVVCEGKTFAYHLMHICIDVYFLKNCSLRMQREMILCAITHIFSGYCRACCKSPIGLSPIA